ncbi:FPC/CPF motif-containing protein YcgG [Paenibacillus shirakamiensis]|uniref:FPC/CPF motif-containing protein YcgG n=1 Tax=Paenibacillus shirakamiensis TaxID=1265935 RepID=A0ABS4JDU8_9BACL|nr:YqcI/YcgG family protein [Paenibacillus shirakamiensis]MBP1999882.1 FPC/CPF motif-containing protein YcgG [Paenibacillus shirakamiensis]
MTILRTKSWLDEHIGELPAWQQKAFEQFTQMIDNPEGTYPCVPGRQGFVNDNLRFGFVVDPRTDCAATQTGELLKAYGDCSRQTGKFASLVLFYETPSELLDGHDVEDYEDLFWSLLRRVSSTDEVPWPEEISTDPEDHTWEYCHSGQPYFAFCATPAHEHRKSRSFSTFLVAFQPRWVFEEINDSTASGRNMKKLIRKKLEAYDGIPAHPSLKWYGQPDNHEWKQYFLRDDESGPSKCPYTRMKNKMKALGQIFQ